MKKIIAVALAVAAAACAQQSGPTSVSTVLPWSATYSPSYVTGSGLNVTLHNSILGIYTQTASNVNLATNTNVSAIFNPANYPIQGGTFASLLQVANSLNASIATALSVIPLASPASGVIVKTDPATGTPLPVSSTLGPIYTERAETIGKHKFYLGVTHQDFHFTSLNGHSLNSTSVLYGGGQSSNVANGGATQTTVPATFNLGMDIRLSQNVAFLTYGLTDRVDVSVGLPMVHAAEEARTYDATLYGGAAIGAPFCWCVDTFTPGAPTLYDSQIGVASMGKTGIGDVLFRVKGTVIEKPNAAVAVGVDVRAPTGDSSNYLGTGAASVKPFTAVSLYTASLGNVVFAPHLNFGWQISGQSPLGGNLQGTVSSVNVGGTNYSYLGAPFTTSSAKLPDVLSWAVGTEVAAGRHNTFVVDILGNEIGLINGVPTTVMQSIPGLILPEPPQTTDVTTTATGLVSGGRVSFSQYSGSFGYKARVIGNLVVTSNMLVRFDNNGLTARFTPMYGLSYTFGAQ